MLKAYLEAVRDAPDHEIGTLLVAKSKSGPFTLVPLREPIRVTGNELSGAESPLNPSRLWGGDVELHPIEHSGACKRNRWLGWTSWLWCGIRVPLFGIIYIVAGPLALLVDLLSPRRNFAAGWVVGYILLALAATAGSWGLGELREDAEYAWTTQLTENYYQARDNLQDLPYADLVRLYAARNDLDPALVAAVVQRESTYDPNAVSRAGARGLMQILPSTWRYLNPESSCPADHAPPSCGPGCIFDPAANMRVGTRYLRLLLGEFDGDVVLATAAYNAGPSAVRRLGRQEPAGIPPFRETRQYVRDVLYQWADLRQEPRQAIVAMELGTLGRLARGIPAFSAGLWLVFCLWTLRRLPWTLHR